MQSIIDIKGMYNSHIDATANGMAIQFVEGKPITIEVLQFLNSLYESAKLNQFNDFDAFESAYHNPVTSDFELLLARIIYHIAKIKGKQWKVLLRKQKGKCAPDIRIEHEGRSICVIEIKVKVGWSQDMFSNERYQYDLNKFGKDPNRSDPKIRIEKLSSQYSKYIDTFKVSSNEIYVIVGSLQNVHRKKNKGFDIDYYKKSFMGNSQLEYENIIILAHSLDRDMSKAKNTALLLPSDELEKMLNKIFY